MKTVADVIAENPNILVEINGKETKETWDPWCEFLWEGMLYETPAKLRGLEVVNEGYRIGKKIHSLEVFVTPWKEVGQYKLF